MKVLAAIVVPPHLSVSGAARAALELSSALTSHCDVSIASMQGGSYGRQALAEVPVRTWLPPLFPWGRLPNRYSTLFYRSDLAKAIKREKYDIVHLHNPIPALELERTAEACLANNVPYVVSTHGFNEVARGDVYGFNSVKKLMWKRLVSDPVARVVRRAAAIFALSPADFEIVRDMGFKGPNLSVVSNGVVPPGIGNKADDLATLRRLGIPAAREPGQITCMFLANHTPNKGLPVLLESFAALDRPYLLIVGGEKRAGIDYDRYLRCCRPGQRIVVTGRLSDDDVGALFRRSDMFVFPTLADTFPLVVLEAMSHGLPVLASRVGGIPYQVDKQCGRLVDPGSRQQLTAALDELAEFPARLVAMGRSARIRVTAGFTWQRAALDAMDGYSSVLGKTVLPASLAHVMGKPTEEGDYLRGALR